MRVASETTTGMARSAAQMVERGPSGSAHLRGRILVVLVTRVRGRVEAGRTLWAISRFHRSRTWALSPRTRTDDSHLRET
jgi:hypothetical protein